MVYVMKDRKPLHLKPLLIIWNGCLAVFSILGMIRTWEEWLTILGRDGFYTSICYTYPTYSVTGHWFAGIGTIRSLFRYLIFAISKFVELGLFH